MDTITIGEGAELTIYKFIDKDTGQHIAYCPVLDISGYGVTEGKASEMLEFSVREYLKNINEQIDNLTDYTTEKINFSI